MENRFFHTHAGALTIAFLVIMAAFFIIIAGNNSGNDTLCVLGFVLILLAVLYSPFKIQVIDRLKKEKSQGYEPFKSGGN